MTCSSSVSPRSTSTRKVVLAHSWSAVIDGDGEADGTGAVPAGYMDAPRASEQFRSMLFDGWGDDEGGVVRMDVLRGTPLHGSYHFADRTFTAELALHGPFYMVPDWLYFRREHAGQAGRSARRCGAGARTWIRAGRSRHPVARLYAEYFLSYATAIQRAPLSASQRLRSAIARCWPASSPMQALPVVSRTLSRTGLDAGRELVRR